jgi:hypothetical protein
MQGDNWDPLHKRLMIFEAPVAVQGVQFSVLPRRIIIQHGLGVGMSL